VSVPAPRVVQQPGSGPRQLVSDSLVIARRDLAHIRVIPEKLLDVTVQPLMFVLLFAFVFGGVIAIPDGGYREYLIGGILVQTLVFGMIGPATSMASDLGEGIVDRFRSLPMHRSAFLLGHLLAALAASIVAVTVMVISGLEEAEFEYAGLNVVFLLKPLSPDLLLSHLHLILQHLQAGAA